MNRGKPFQSKLTPFYDAIRAMRRQRKTWREVAEAISGLGTPTEASAVYKFAKRHSKRKAGWGVEDDKPVIVTPTETPHQSAKLAILEEKLKELKEKRAAEEAEKAKAASEDEYNWDVDPEEARRLGIRRIKQ